nr:IS3 family transposase [Rhizobium sp. Q54]
MCNLYNVMTNRKRSARSPTQWTGWSARFRMTGDARRRRWTTEQKLTVIEQSFEPGETESSIPAAMALRPICFTGGAGSSARGAAAVGSDEPVVGNSEVKKLEDRVRELERMFGWKTMEAEMLRDAFSKADPKHGISRRSCCRRTVPDEGHRRHIVRLPFHPVGAVERQIKVTRAYSKSGHAELLPTTRRPVDQRLTYGYRRIAALLNRNAKA